MLNKILILGLLIFSRLAFADVTQLSNNFCTPSLDRVLGDAINYDGLKNLQGAKYYDPKLGILLLSMAQSQAVFNVKNDQQTDANVWLVLQPTNLTNKSLYPRFLLHCTSQKTATSFDHQCQMYPNAQHFGLTDFVSHIHGDANGCGNGQAKVSYDVTMTASEADIQAIKAGVAHFSAFTPVVDSLFHENRFFSDYFGNLFTNWLHGVQ